MQCFTTGYGHNMKYYVTNISENFVEGSKEFVSNPGSEMKQIKVYPSVTYQTMLGMGAAFTEAAAYTWSKMSRRKRNELLDVYFGKNGSHYTYCRTHIQSCDFALGNYAYVEDAADAKLRTFQIDRDKKYLIPLIKAALKKDSHISLLASPWSPPSFMKTNGEMNHGGKLKKEYYERWASIIAKYVQEYRKSGITIQHVTVQNEPLATQTWDSCIFTAEEEREYACTCLHKALDSPDGEKTGIFIWDHNKEKLIERAGETLASNDAAEKIQGIAFHWYTGDHFEEVREIHRMFPDKELIMSEGCVEYSRNSAKDPTAYAEIYAHDIIGNFNAGTNAFIDWNMYLDAQGGPNHAGNYCDAPVMCDTETDTFTIQKSYYYIKHFSSFIQPGAKRILLSRYTDRIEGTAFSNPDGSKTAVLLNKTDEPQPFTFCETDKTCDFELAGHSIMTVCW
jgi:glucosylceramidase